MRYCMSMEYEKHEIDSQFTRTLSLTRNEALYIDDSLSLMIEREAFGDTRIGTMRLQMLSAPLGAPIDLIDKITYAVLYTTDDANKGKEADVQVSDEDLYMLREIAQSYVKVGSELVGYNLKKKIYALLHSEYTSDEEWNQVLAPFDSIEQRLKNIVQSKKTEES